MMDTERLPLSGLLPELAAEGYELPVGLTYRYTWNAVVNGRLPAMQVNGRYYIYRKDKPAIAALLGIALPPVKSNSAEPIAA